MFASREEKNSSFTHVFHFFDLLTINSTDLWMCFTVETTLLTLRPIIMIWLFDKHSASIHFIFFSYCLTLQSAAPPKMHRIRSPINPTHSCNGTFFFTLKFHVLQSHRQSSKAVKTRTIDFQPYHPLESCHKLLFLSLNPKGIVRLVEKAGIVSKRVIWHLDFELSEISSESQIFSVISLNSACNQLECMNFSYL